MSHAHLADIHIGTLLRRVVFAPAPHLRVGVEFGVDFKSDGGDI